MTGVAWVDWLAAGAFGLLAVVSLGRLARRRSAGERADAAAHGVMAAGMAAMTLPTGNPVPAGAWVAVFAVVAAGAAGSLVRSPRRRPTPPPIRGPGPPPAGAAGMAGADGAGGAGDAGGSSRLWPAAAAHHVAASALMIVLLTTGVGPSASGVASPAAHHHQHGDAASQAVSAAATPPTPLVTAAGIGFLAYAGWLAVGIVRPGSRLGAARCACGGGLTRGDAACGVAMAAGMGLMALAMA